MQRVVPPPPPPPRATSKMYERKGNRGVPGARQGSILITGDVDTIMGMTGEQKLRDLVTQHVVQVQTNLSRPQSPKSSFGLRITPPKFATRSLPIKLQATSSKVDCRQSIGNCIGPCLSGMAG